MFYTDTGELDIKKIVRIIVALGVAIGLIVVLWLVFTRGGLRIDTSAENAKISVTSESNNEETTNPAPGGISILPIGSYIVTITEGKKQIRSHVAVERFSVKTISLTPPDVTNTEPVTNITTASFAVSSNGLSIYDSEKEQLVFIDANNSVKKTDLALRYTTAVWESPGNGYAVAHPEADPQARQFMRITNGSSERFDTPNPMTNQTYLAFAVDNGTLYVLQDGTLYKRSSSVYEPVSTFPKGAVFLSANEKYITLLSENENEECEIINVTTGSKDVKKIPIACVHNPDYRQSARWSPDTRLLAASIGNALVIYNTDLKVQHTIPDDTANNPVWVSDTAIVYVSGNNLWKYDTSSKTTSVVSALPQYITLQDLKYKKEGNEFYFTGRSDAAVSLYRTVDTSKDTRTAQMLGESNMHELSNYCRIRYVNFSKLTIAASVPQDGQVWCRDEIKNYFEAIQIDQPPVQYDTTEFNFPTD